MRLFKSLNRIDRMFEEAPGMCVEGDRLGEFGGVGLLH